MTLNFRKAESEDLQYLISLEKDAFLPYQQNSERNLKRGIDSIFQEILVVENGISGEALGAIALFKYKYTLRIYSIAIGTAHRKKGIGDQMITYIKDYGLQNGYSSISLEVRSENDGLINWYASKGFEEISRNKNYYGEGQDALKMKLDLKENTLDEKHKNIIVINHPYEWELKDIKAKTISVKEYINNPLYQNNSTFRVFNLCSSYKYQSYGYYVSLLASARGQRVIPSIATIRDFGMSHVIQSVLFEVNELLNKLLEKEEGNTVSLDIYFGQTMTKGYKKLANKLYQIFEAPMFRITFIKDDHWIIKKIKVLTLGNISDEQKETMYHFAVSYFNKKRYNYPQLLNYKYDLAILINPDEKNPPSNQAALEKMKSVANKKGLFVEFITKDDRNKINEFDALFIRETTNVNHHTYELSRLAFAEGLVVLDDPWSILKCSNKIFQHELFKKNKIKTPNSIVITKNRFNDQILNELHYPIVLKQPDSAFSLGVIKASSKEEAEKELLKLFKKTDMVICQEFMYSEFDWRIGILDNKPIFACKYFMSKNHWQIYDWNSAEEDKSGESETLPITSVPKEVLRVAQKAASLIGDGLYGVDLKYVDGNVFVIEVNDNPNLDAGVEDFVLKDGLYEILIDSIINRIELAKNILKINLIKDH